MREQPKCRKCGKLLQFIKTKKGKMMPVDSFSVHVMPSGSGALYWLEDGNTVRGYLCDKTAPGAVKAYEPHWYTCPDARDLKKEAPKKNTTDEIRARILREREEQARKEETRRRKEAEREERIQAELAQTSLFLNREEVYR